MNHYTPGCGGCVIFPTQENVIASFDFISFVVCYNDIHLAINKLLQMLSLVGGQSLFHAFKCVLVITREPFPPFVKELTDTGSEKYVKVWQKSMLDCG